MSLVVTRVVGLATVQDLGRPGHMHEALAPGGALVPELLIEANRAAGNTDGAAAIEVFGQLHVRATTAIATSHGTLAAGDAIVVASEPARVAYLAIAGGVDAPIVLASRSTQLSAGIGAALRAGDTITPVRAGGAIAPSVHASLSGRGIPLEARTETFASPIRIVPGPDLDVFAPDALARLTAAPYRILPSSDRIGTRLAGAALAGSAPLSRPMVRGALEVPPDGQPIALGPEHPTTGGYPIVAVIAHADLGRFFAIRLGDPVTFALS